MNNDLISRNALLEVICRLYPKHPAYLSPTVDAQLFGFCNGISNALLEVDHAPAVEAEPIRHGRWIQAEGKTGVWYCSECGERISYNQNRRTYKPAKKPVHEVNRRCRCCGARMDGDTGAKS